MLKGKIFNVLITNGTLNIEDEDKLKDMLNKDELTLEEILHLNMCYELAIGNLRSSLKLLRHYKKQKDKIINKKLKNYGIR